MKIITFLSSLFISITCHSQFLNEEAVWTTGLRCPDPECKWSYLNTSFVDDTVIGGVNYYLEETEVGLFAFREENNVIFYKGLKSRNLNIDSLEHVLYDFNLLVNDTFDILYCYSDTISWIVTSVDSIIIGSEFKKRLSLQESTELAYKRECTIIEDIGSSYGPLWFLYITQNNYDAELYCYRINNDKLYGKCDAVDVSNIKKDAKNYVFYDPLNHQLNVNLSDEEVFILNIYTLTGTKIYSQKFQNKRFVNTSFLETGFYIVELDINKFRFCQKINICG